MKSSTPRFTRQYPMDNGITLRLTMVMREQQDRDYMLVEYGPPTVSKAAFFALGGTPQYRGALEQFANEYAQLLKFRNPSYPAGEAR